MEKQNRNLTLPTMVGQRRKIFTFEIEKVPSQATFVMNLEENSKKITENKDKKDKILKKSAKVGRLGALLRSSSPYSFLGFCKRH